ncbi:hypothetical protein G7068_03360 [Leucobacter viscericola]|uniref:Uncharacterized protein n=1 Tax=Leucobacter viscericola TaxID=2714935 RepID=A0A6G7XCR8_9MICO|nr:hypothetical protein [Leucobacter viscericola]QIK62353.1 hypothetical protein G7068_03360 [Leucobacter viscericola]
MAKRTCKVCKKRFEGDKRRRYCSAQCKTGKQEVPVLRAVEPGEVVELDTPDPLKPRTMSVAEAFAEGTDLEQLLALRNHLAKLMAEASPRDASALSRQLRDLRREIASLELSLREEVEESETTPDEAWVEEAL